MRKRVINLVKVVTPRGLTNDPGHGSIKMTPKAVGREERGHTLHTPFQRLSEILRLEVLGPEMSQQSKVPPSFVV